MKAAWLTFVPEEEEAPETEDDFTEGAVVCAEESLSTSSEPVVAGVLAFASCSGISQRWVISEGRWVQRREKVLQRRGGYCDTCRKRVAGGGGCDFLPTVREACQVWCQSVEFALVVVLWKKKKAKKNEKSEEMEEKEGKEEKEEKLDVKSNDVNNR